ncbi:MAG: RNA polymerase sigma factor [Bacteroidales bacterium]|jgi:RNA polymerase sigma factor (sigma-70 family)
MKLISESYYISQTLKGNTEQFAYLVEKYQDMVFSIILKIVNNKEDAEDIAQNVFIIAYNKLDTFKQNSKFSTWLYSIAYNEAVSFYKKNKKTTFITIDTNLNGSFDKIEDDTDSDFIYSNENVNKLKESLKKLKDDENLIITLFYKMDNSIEEIAEITNMSISNVKVKLFRTRKKLLKFMTDDTKK